MPIVLFVIGLLIIVFWGFIFFSSKTDIVLHNHIGKTAVDLTLVAILIGLAKLFYEDMKMRQGRKADKIQFIRNILDDIKKVYDRVERARLLIPAHQSAKTYGNEMRDLIEARVSLLNIERVLDKTADLNGQEISIKADVKQMEGYLLSLINEFKKKYKPISDQQRLDENKFKKNKRLKGSCKSTWKIMIDELPMLEDFINADNKPNNDSSYCQEFIGPLQDISSELRKLLKGQLGYGAGRKKE